MCDTKIINSKCICNNQFINSNNIIVSLCPCEHLIHLDCITVNQMCPLCKTRITKYVKFGDHKTDCKYIQQCIDILSVTAEKKSHPNIFSCLSRIPNIFDIGSKFMFAKTKSDYQYIISSTLSLANYSIKIKGLNKIKNLEKKVFISNHVGNFDAIILYYFLNCGFLASIQNQSVLSSVEHVIPVVYIKRGKKQDTVKTMKDFIDKHGSICIFPEGIYARVGTLIRFRSGAFKIGYPIYPIVLKYKNFSFACNRCDVLQVALQYGSLDNVDMEIEILDPIYPPFNDETPEKIRESMAKSGNLVLSRVMSNDLKD